MAAESAKGCPPDHWAPTASFTHFFSKLFLAAPASFFSWLFSSHCAVASLSHFLRNEVLAAPASFFSAAAAWQEADSASTGALITRAVRIPISAVLGERAKLGYLESKNGTDHGTQTEVPF